MWQALTVLPFSSQIREPNTKAATYHFEFGPRNEAPICMDPNPASRQLFAVHHRSSLQKEQVAHLETADRNLGG
jgi:hypothetical protein